MIATTTVTSAHPSVVPANLLTTSQAASYAGVHPNTLRTWADAGNIRTVRVADVGWRRYDATSIAEYMGIVEQRTEDEGPQPVAYCRVSSESQDKQGNLRRQIEDMRREVAAREGSKLSFRTSGLEFLRFSRG